MGYRLQPMTLMACVAWTAVLGCNGCNTSRPPANSHPEELATNPRPTDPNDIPLTTYVWWVSSDKGTLFRHLCPSYRQKFRSHEACVGDATAEEFTAGAEHASFLRFKAELGKLATPEADVPGLLKELEAEDLWDFRRNDAAGNNISFHSDASPGQQKAALVMDEAFAKSR